MCKTIQMILLAVLVSACQPNKGTKGAATLEREGTGDGQYNAEGIFDSSRARSDDCDNTGGTHTNLFYGNHEIRTAGTVHLKAGKIFAIRLKPANDANNRPGIDYESETVTISAKDIPSVWLSASGEYNTTPPPQHELIICVPVGTPNGNYYYNIQITDTGSLDPRAEVY